MILSSRLLWSGLATLALASLTNSAQVQDDQKLVGVCTIDPQSVSCWDLERKVSSELTEEVKTFLLESEARISFRTGLSNRYLIFSGAFQAFSITGGASFVYAGNPKTQSKFTILQVDVPLGEEHPRVRITVPKKVPNAVATVAFRDHATTTLAGKPFEFGTFWSQDEMDRRSQFNGFGRSAGMSGYFPFSGQSVTWAIPFAWDGGSPGYDQVNCVALGKSNKPVEYVDITGAPATKEEFDRENPKGYFEWGEGRHQVYFRTSVNGAISGSIGAGYISSNIDPKYVSQLQLSVFRSEPLFLDTVPMNPDK